MNKAKKVLVAVSGTAALLAVGICIGILIRDNSLSQKSNPVQDIYTIAQQSAEKKCTESGGTNEECINLRTTSIQDVSCLNLAPQNGGKDRCGYWSISFTSSTTYTPFKIIEIEVRYDGSVKSVSLQNAK